MLGPSIGCPNGTSIILNLSYLNVIIYKQVSNKDLLYSTQIDSQYFVKIYVGKESENYKYIYIHILQILKDDTVKMQHSICQKIWKTQQWPQNWKRSVFIPIPKKGNAKECSNYRTIALISHASKVMLKILQARLQQYVN